MVQDEMEKIFEINDPWVMKYFLSMEVLQLSDGIAIYHKKYILDILIRFKMQDCKSLNTPISIGVKYGNDEDFEKVDDCIYRTLISSLLYQTPNIPDILFL